MRRRYLSIDQHSVRYMTVEPLENGVYLSFGGDGLYYSIDDSEWVSLPMNTNTPSINIGQTIRIKGLNITTSFNRRFSINGKCKLSGTIMSILYGDKPYEEKVTFNSCFAYAFSQCTSIVSVAPNFLPATTLAYNCYVSMFYGCTSLTTAPELPATTLTPCCYEDMFSHCTSLTTAPELPATTLTDTCYRYMFSHCTSLTTAPELPATTLTPHCYTGMFYGCTKLDYIKMLATDIFAIGCLNAWVYNVSSTGTFVKNPAMATLLTGTSGIPSGWTIVNDGEESGELSFPVMLTSVEGSGNNRTVEPNDQTLALVQYINDNVEFDGNIWRIPTIDEFIILDNEITFCSLYGYGSTTWDYFMALGGSNKYWSMIIYPNGNIMVHYSD